MVTTQQVRRTITASDISRTRSTKLDQNKKYNRREGWPDLHWNPTTTFALPLRNNNPLSAYYTMVEVKEAGLMWVSRRIGPDFRWKSHCRDRTPTNKSWYSSLKLQIIHKTNNIPRVSRSSTDLLASGFLVSPANNTNQPWCSSASSLIIKHGIIARN